MHRFTLTTTEAPRQDRRPPPRPLLTVDCAPRNPRTAGVTLEPQCTAEPESGTLAWYRTLVLQEAERGGEAAEERLDSWRGHVMETLARYVHSAELQSRFQPKETRAAWLAQRLADEREAADAMLREEEQRIAKRREPAPALEFEPDEEEKYEAETALWIRPLPGRGISFTLAVEGIGAVVDVRIAADVDTQARIMALLAELHAEYRDGTHAHPLTVLH